MAPRGKGIARPVKSAGEAVRVGLFLPGSTVLSREPLGGWRRQLLKPLPAIPPRFLARIHPREAVVALHYEKRSTSRELASPAVNAAGLVTIPTLAAGGRALVLH